MSGVGCANWCKAADFSQEATALLYRVQKCYTVSHKRNQFSPQSFYALHLARSRSSHRVSRRKPQEIRGPTQDGQWASRTCCEYSGRDETGSCIYPDSEDFPLQSSCSRVLAMSTSQHTTRRSNAKLF